MQQVAEVQRAFEMTPEQYYIETGCTANELADVFKISLSKARTAQDRAIKIVQNQRRLELMIQSGEDLEPEIN